MIQCQSECVVDHTWEVGFEERAGFVEAGVCVDFDQPRIVRIVDHEVIAEDLEAVLAGHGVHF